MNPDEIKDLIEEKLQEILEHDEYRPEEVKNGNGIITNWVVVTVVTPINPDTDVSYYSKLWSGKNQPDWMTKGLLLEALDELRGLSHTEED